MKLFLKNTRTGKRYEIVKVDKVAGTITLKGPHAQFTEPYDKEQFKRLGYTLDQQGADGA